MRQQPAAQRRTRVGVALPAQVSGATGCDIERCAKETDQLGFESAWVLDRLVYDSFATVPILGALATSVRVGRIGTSILLPLLRSPVLLAKELATVDAMSGGRLNVGLAIGGREIDYQAAGVPFARRAARMNEYLDVLQLAWDGAPISYEGEFYRFDLPPIGPLPVQRPRPPLWLGGRSDAALARAIHRADGYIMGRSGPTAQGSELRRIAEASEVATRADPVEVANVVFFCVGDDRRICLGQLESYHRTYYASDQKLDITADCIFGGRDEAAERLVEFLTPDLEGRVVDQLVLVPVSSAPDQLTRLAEAVNAAGVPLGPSMMGRP